ncbi:nucleobase:cation symporter-2 family protein [uncultured Azohydromonas sp.]|jgi:xanthine permease|uniref:nucleobase:cation symporter-2 family protein n=1 Tax=uncultured Azohydromonas sp. TaxID=487342 RepID=UPI0026170F38|nr:nucleobase:cation symporter-2 family protein [uncultured Azohydromonas sp.]
MSTVNTLEASDALAETAVADGKQPVHPVDEVLPAGKLAVLGLQHVLVMYAGAVAVPLIIGGALKLPKDQIALLINADLLCSGIVTLIQAIGFWRFGIRLPVMMGVTFAAVGPMLAMAANPALGLTGIFGSVIAAGIFATLAAPFISRLLPLFPPVVTGVIISTIGLSLVRVAANWAGGGVANPNFGDPLYLGVALVVLLSIVLITRFVRGFFANISVLLGLVIGFVIALALGQVSFAGIAEAPWVSAVVPFAFGAPTFDLVAIATMCVVMIVVMIESMGMFLALGDVTQKKVGMEDLARGLRVDGLGTLIGGILNTFPHTSFSQNVGLVSVTGVRSRYVCVAGGFIMLALGMLPKLALVVASVPQFVLGGAGIVMFGMVAATGIRILHSVDFRGGKRHNLYIVAISIGMGLIPEISPKFFSKMPHVLEPLLHSGILLAAVTAVVLNLIYNGWEHAKEGAHAH